MRTGGPRVEREKIDGVEVVHSYGHAGYGYQSGWGSAWEAEKQVLDILNEDRTKARL